ncbi:MAG: AtpZ/AtpI family protein [Candidatus Aminicenantes bacterium]|nr:AtpZ/AtpI family protein [Candidatus Aminicenantes bacterium]
MTDKKDFRSDLKKLAEVSSLGLMLPSSIVVGLIIGHFLDRIFGSHPWLLLIFTCLGVISGLLSLFRGLKKYQKG